MYANTIETSSLVVTSFLPEMPKNEGFFYTFP